VQPCTGSSNRKSPGDEPLSGQPEAAEKKAEDAENHIKTSYFHSIAGKALLL
jgi:hypothetical protein